MNVRFFRVAYSNHRVQAPRHTPTDTHIYIGEATMSSSSPGKAVIDGATRTSACRQAHVPHPLIVAYGIFHCFTILLLVYKYLLTYVLS
jgi:hypothetical protein